MTRVTFILFCTFVIFAYGCGGGPKYVPDITLTKAGPIIDAIAEFHNLYPTYALLSGKETFGLDAPKAERVEPSELTGQVESELLKELDAAGIFSRTTRFHRNPDVILSGRIMALYEHYRPQIWAKIPDFFPVCRDGHADASIENTRQQRGGPPDTLRLEIDGRGPRYLHWPIYVQRDLHSYSRGPSRCPPQSSLIRSRPSNSGRDLPRRQTEKPSLTLGFICIQIQITAQPRLMLSSGWSSS